MGEEVQSQIKRTLHGDEKFERLSAIKAEKSMEKTEDE